jgi:hypothetical protein
MDMPVKDFLRRFSRKDIPDDDAEQGRQKQLRQGHEPQRPPQRRLGQQ